MALARAFINRPRILFCDEPTGNLDGATAQAIRMHAANAAAWGSVYVEATIGATTWRTSLFPSKQVGGWLLPLKAAVRKAEKIAEGSVIEAVLALPI